MRKCSIAGMRGMVVMTVHTLETGEMHTGILSAMFTWFKLGENNIFPKY